MTAVAPMFELPVPAWNVPVFAIYPMVPMPALHVGMVTPFHWGTEDEGSRMRKAMAAMPVHFSLCEEPRRKILCYGDSLTAGFFAGGLKFDPYGRSMSEVLASAGIDAQVSVCGHSGCTTREMLEAAESDLADVVGCTGNGLCKILAEQDFDLVIIMSGTNDMGKGTHSDAIVEDLSQLHAICHRQGVPTLALAPPSAPRFDFSQALLPGQHHAVPSGLHRPSGACVCGRWPILGERRPTLRAKGLAGAGAKLGPTGCILTGGTQLPGYHRLNLFERQLIAIF